MKDQDSPSPGPVSRATLLSRLKIAQKRVLETKKKAKTAKVAYRHAKKIFKQAKKTAKAAKKFAKELKASIPPRPFARKRAVKTVRATESTPPVEIPVAEPALLDTIESTAPVPATN